MPFFPKPRRRPAPADTDISTTDAAPRPFRPRPATGTQPADRPRFQREERNEFSSRDDRPRREDRPRDGRRPAGAFPHAGRPADRRDARPGSRSRNEAFQDPWVDGQPRFLVIVCAALAAMAVGGLYAFLPGVLKVKVKVNEVITTIMLNTIAAYLCQYLAKGPWKNANKNMVAATEQLGAQYWFGSVIPRSNLTSAVFAAAVMAFLVWYVMERTSVGYEMRITGENPRFAFFSGLRTDQIVLLSMVVSGAMCGLVGMFRVYGVEHLYRDSVSKDYYFEALMVAMIAQYKPVTVILLSLFFAVLKIGAQGMELAAGVPNQIYLIIQTVVIFLMAAESGLFGALQNRVRKGKEAEKHA